MLISDRFYFDPTTKLADFVGVGPMLIGSGLGGDCRDIGLVVVRPKPEFSGQ